MAGKTKKIHKKQPFFKLGMGFIVLAIVFCSFFIFTVYKNQPNVTDYSKPEHWLSLPPSSGKKVDVFYLYPTSYQKINTTDPDICDIDNPSMLKTAKVNLEGQASAFETVANIYAPYYRQVDARFVLGLSLVEQAKFIGGIPVSDATAAFEYYIKHYNQGRPFILAGHSQGSNVMLYLLSDYMKKNPKVYERMIAAYVIGYSVTPDYLDKNPHLKFAEGTDDIGVIVSYNTEAPDVTENNPVLLPGALVINPITWTRTEDPVPASESLGSFISDEEGNFTAVMNYADARVNSDRGVVVSSTPDVEKLSPGNPVFGKGVYHVYDYQFYYFNLRENAVRRVESFLNK